MGEGIQYLFHSWVQYSPGDMCILTGDVQGSRTFHHLNRGCLQHMHPLMRKMCTKMVKSASLLDKRLTCFSITKGLLLRAYSTYS